MNSRGGGNNDLGSECGCKLVNRRSIAAFSVALNGVRDETSKTTTCRQEQGTSFMCYKLMTGISSVLDRSDACATTPPLLPWWAGLHMVGVVNRHIEDGHEHPT